MAILTIDQEKAFDRIDHRYIFKVLNRNIWWIVCRSVLLILYDKETIGPKGIFYHCLMNMED